MNLLSSLSAAAVVAASIALIGPAQAQFNEQQMKEMLKAAEGLGQGQATGDACGVDYNNMATLVARGWKCQGASADQLAKLQAAAAESRKKNKVAACPTDKAAAAKQVAQTAANLEAGLTKANCKG